MVVLFDYFSQKILGAMKLRGGCVLLYAKDTCYLLVALSFKYEQVEHRAIIKWNFFIVYS